MFSYCSPGSGDGDDRPRCEACDRRFSDLWECHKCKRKVCPRCVDAVETDLCQGCADIERYDAHLDNLLNAVKHTGSPKDLRAYLQHRKGA